MDVSPSAPASLDDWYYSPHGAYALECQQRLMQKMLSAWPRRGHSLLSIGCGSGHSLYTLWEAGFDVTATDANPLLLTLAREKLHSRVSLEIAQPDHLPYVDNTFDFAVLSPVPSVTENIEEILREAVRVSSKGMLICFWNPTSLAGVTRNSKRSTLYSWHNTVLWARQRMYKQYMRKLAPKAGMHVRSVLWTPPLFWKANMPSFLAATCPFTLGALAILQVEYLPLQPLTGLPLRIGKMYINSTSPQPVMESGQTRNSTQHL